jgi:hypothetical protein
MTPTDTATLSPTLTASPSPAPTGTASATSLPTPIASDCLWEILYQSDAAPGLAAIARPVLLIRNTGASFQDLAALSLDYWFHQDGRLYQATVVSADAGAGSLAAKVVTELKGACLQDQSGRLQLRFLAQLLAPGAVLRVELALSRKDQAAWDQALDWSALAAPVPVMDAHLPVYCHGFLQQGSRPAEGFSLPIDPQAQDFSCLLWHLQDRMDAMVSAVVQVQRQRQALPATTPEPTLVWSPTPEVRQKLFLQAPHFLRSESSAVGYATVLTYVRNDEAVSLEVGSNKGEMSLGACDPTKGLRLPDWLVPKQVTKAYDYFGRFNFSLESSGAGEATWTTEDSLGFKVSITVDLQQGVIKREHFRLKADGSEADIIEGLVYEGMPDQPRLRAVRIRSQQPGLEHIFDYSYDYQQVGSVLPLETFR